MATRYGKPAISYRAAVALSARITWTRIEETRSKRSQWRGYGFG